MNSINRPANTHTILACDLFCGSGGTSTGLMQAAEALGMDVSLVAVNHWQTAIDTHTANHPNVSHFCEDLETINPRHAVPGGRLDLLVASPECFPAGTLILTQDGLLPIEQVKVGVKVLSHRGVWRPVTSVMSTVKDTVIVNGHGHFGLETTAEHPLYTRQKKRVWNNGRRAWEFEYLAPTWTPAADAVGLSWATPTACAPLPIPHPPGPFSANNDFWWIVGRWLGDGSGGLRPGKGGEINICCGHHDADDLRCRLQSALPPTINLRETVKRTATSFDFCHTEFARWITTHFGKLAHGKTLPAWALSMPKSWRSSLMTGYLSADGHFDGRKQEATTVSRSLAIAIRLLAEGLGFRAALHTAPQHCNVIEGRTVNARDVYRVMWVAAPKHEYSREIDGMAWSRISSVQAGRTEMAVYNLSVAEDESYVADGIVVHNCTHHSNARGGRPMSDQSRASVWHVLRWADALFIENILIENVRELRDWGPLGEDGRPIPAMKGRLYRQFLASLRALGYVVSERILNSADFGDATTRQRLFIQARRGGKRPSWPAPSHIKPAVVGSLPGLMDGIPTWKPARDIIDWSLPSNSIYTRKRPLADATMARIFAGLRKYSGLPFIVPQFSSQGPRDIERPIGTLTTQSRGVGLAEPFLVKFYGGHDATSLNDPLPTVTANYEHFGLAEPFLIGAGDPGGAGQPQAVSDPLGTVLGVNHRGLVQPYLVILQNNRDGQSLERPLPTVLTSGAHFGIAEPFITNMEHSSEGHSRRCYDMQRPIPTITSKGMFGLCEPFLTEFHGGANGADRTRSISDPLCTLDTSNRVGLAEPFLVSYYGQGGPASLDEPLDTVTTRDRFALVDPQLVTDGMFDKGEVVGWLDIRFRMLQPRELAAAMSFPADYHFAGNREAQVKQIGNAVAVSTAQALCTSILKGLS